MARAAPHPCARGTLAAAPFLKDHRLVGLGFIPLVISVNTRRQGCAGPESVCT